MYTDIYTKEGCHFPPAPPHRTKHTHQIQQQKCCFYGENTFFVVAPLEGCCWWCFQCFFCSLFCIRAWVYVQKLLKNSSWVLGISSACCVDIRTYVREYKSLWKRWKHHPIFCVYGTFWATFSSFHERTFCRLQTLTKAWLRRALKRIRFMPG